MVAKFWLPELSINEYLNRRPKYGDSTDASAQIATLRSFGLDARFVSWGTAAKLKQQLDRGRPAPVGWLHTGHVSSPTGGGHYSFAAARSGSTRSTASASQVHSRERGHAETIDGIIRAHWSAGVSKKRKRAAPSVNKMFNALQTCVRQGRHIGQTSRADEDVTDDTDDDSSSGYGTSDSR